MEDDVRERGAKVGVAYENKKDLSYPINCSVLVRLRTSGSYSTIAGFHVTSLNFRLQNY